jgi:hypothetical protein
MWWWLLDLAIDIFCDLCVHVVDLIFCEDSPETACIECTEIANCTDTVGEWFNSNTQAVYAISPQLDTMLQQGAYVITNLAMLTLAIMLFKLVWAVGRKIYQFFNIVF